MLWRGSQRRLSRPSCGKDQFIDGKLYALWLRPLPLRPSRRFRAVPAASLHTLTVSKQGAELRVSKRRGNDDRLATGGRQKWLQDSQQTKCCKLRCHCSLLTNKWRYAGVSIIILPSDIYESYACFVVFTFVCCQDWVLYFFLLITFSKILCLHLLK